MKSYIGIIILAFICHRYFKYCDKLDAQEKQNDD